MISLHPNSFNKPINNNNNNNNKQPQSIQSNLLNNGKIAPQLPQRKLGGYSTTTLPNNSTKASTSVIAQNNNLGSSFKQKSIPTITNPSVLKSQPQNKTLLQPSLPSKSPINPPQLTIQNQLLPPPPPISSSSSSLIQQKIPQLPQPIDISQQQPNFHQPQQQFSSPINHFESDTHQQQFFIQTPSRCSTTSPIITSQNLYPSAQQQQQQHQQQHQQQQLPPPQQPMINIKVSKPSNKVPANNKQQLPPPLQKQISDQDSEMDDFFTESDLNDAFKTIPHQLQQSIIQQTPQQQNSSIKNIKSPTKSNDKYEEIINHLKEKLISKEKEINDILEREKERERERKREREVELEKQREREKEKKLEKRKAEIDIQSENAKKLKSESLINVQNNIQKEKIILDEILDDISTLNPYINLKPTFNKELQPITKQKAKMNEQASHIFQLFTFKNGLVPSILSLLPSNFSSPLIMNNSSSILNPYVQTPLLITGGVGVSNVSNSSSGLNNLLPPLKQSSISQNSSSSKNNLQQQQQQSQQQQQPQQQSSLQQPQQQQQQLQQQQQPQQLNQQQQQVLNQTLPKPETINEPRHHHNPNESHYSKTPISAVTPSTNTATQKITQTQRSKSNLDSYLYQQTIIPPQFSEDLSENISTVISLQRPCCSLFRSLLPFIKLNSILPIEKSLDVILTLLITCDECLNFFVSDLLNMKYHSSSSSPSQLTSTLISQLPVNTQNINSNNNNNNNSNSPYSQLFNQPHYLTLPNNQTANLYPIPGLIRNPRIFSLSPLFNNNQQNQINNNNNNNNNTLNHHQNNNSNNSTLKEKDDKELQIVTLSSTVNSNSNHEDMQIIKYLIENFNNIFNMIGNNNIKNFKIIDNILKIFILVVDKILANRPSQLIKYNNNISNNKKSSNSSNNYNYNNIYLNIDNSNIALQKFDSLLQQSIIVQMFSNSTTVEQKTLFIELIERFLGQAELVTLLISGNSDGYSEEVFQDGFFIKVAICLSSPISTTTNTLQSSKLICLKLKIVKLLAKAIMIYKKQIGPLFRDVVFQAGVMLISDIFNNTLDLNLFEENEQQKQCTTLIKETLKLICSWFNKFTENISLKGSEKEIDLLKATTLRISKYSHINSLYESIQLCENLVDYIDFSESQLNQNTNNSVDQSTNESDSSPSESNQRKLNK